ncbi:MAG: 4-hydroxythreonine-4-phosphate dehydrogenase PdxA, partial [Planctomycetota bacterium]|nr:4-hydroxythreonine-4-phosphate dehydrogenase PdxA [Planctomycetota bacterium]
MSVNSTRPRIAITMGDPAGIGPEICLDILQETTVVTPVVFGDPRLLLRVAQQIDRPFTAPVISLAAWNGDFQRVSQPCVVDVPLLDAEVVVPGVVNAENGRAAFAYIQAAIDAALAQQVIAVATAPINKEALYLAGIRYPGHTEIFADRCESKRWCMMQYSDLITCTFVTVHVGYAAVPSLLTESRILEVIELTSEGLRRIRGREPRIVVCGLNPHAGEHGLFGEQEEERFIVPAIQKALALGFRVEGPLPPDAAFLPSKRATTDAYVCMYHDQGHIPVKAIAFDQAVNTTVGLP